MSSFSDEDLKRLKMNLMEPSLAMSTDNEFKATTNFSDMILALLDRLEAAELFISAGTAHPMSKRYYEAWKKAAGKDK